MLRRRSALLLSAAVAVVAMLLLAFGAADPLELPVRDAALRVLPARPAAHTIIIAIDEASIRALGPWPWPRETIAALIDRAADGGARAAVLDVLLAESRPGDAEIARAAQRIPTLAVAVLYEQGQWLLPASSFGPAVRPVHGNFELDHDGILRRLASTKQSRDRSLVALSVAAASLVTGAPVPVGVSLAPAFRTHPRAIPAISAAELLRHRRDLRGRLALIGPTALALGDRVLTPASTERVPDPGVTVHAAAVESLIRGETVRELAPILGGLAAGVLFFWIGQARLPVLHCGLAVFAVVASGLVLLGTSGTAVPFVTLTLTAVAALATAQVVRSATRLRDVNASFARHRESEAESKRVLAHELKTPLASMRNLTQLLNTFELSEAERLRVTTLLENEAVKLQSLVGALLDLERLPLRNFESSAVVTDLGALVAARVDFLRASTGRTLVVTTTPDTHVRADTALLERVIDNLVGNAVKYTPAASPVLVNVQRRNGEAILEVEDRGPGIAAADRDRIFQRFYRGSTAAGTEGLGLGLSLVAEIAKWHGGRVSVDAAPTGGARFQVALPGET